MPGATSRTANILPIAVTMGEPAGIGPEIILKAWLNRRSSKLPPFFVLGNAACFVALTEQLGLDIPVHIATPQNAGELFDLALPVVEIGSKVTSSPGHLSSLDAHLVSGAIMKAVELVWDQQASAIVTAPINKKALYDSGFQYPGHTEFLGALAEQHYDMAVVPVMMLAGPELNTIPVTIHISLADVPRRLTTEMIVTAGQIAAGDLKKRFGINDPRIAVSGLNPHAGEGGSMGKEDQQIVAPAVEKLRDLGISAFGPLPADTMFHAAARRTYDVALCMYHDQALIPAKTLAFDDAVNVTLGLPFIRTSPDHGTALNIAGKNLASPSSMIAAIKMAGQMAKMELENIHQSPHS